MAVSFAARGPLLLGGSTFSMLTVPGGIWVPTLPYGWGVNSAVQPANGSTLANTLDEWQTFGYVHMAAGSGTKTFGTSGSKIGWLAGSAIAFVAVASLRIGMKKTTIDTATGPPPRATPGAAAFDVYHDLVGGTDTIVSSLWRNETMDSGTPVSVTHGDIVCISHFLSVTSGTQSIKVSSCTDNQSNLPASIFAAGGVIPGASSSFSGNHIIVFDDSTIAWLEGTRVTSIGPSSPVVGNTNLYGNIFTLPFQCKVDAVMFSGNMGGATANFDFGLWDIGATGISAPTGTINGLTSTVSIDPNVLGANRWTTVTLPNEITLTANIPYAVAMKQNSAGALTPQAIDVDDISYWQANGLDSTCYAAASTAGAAFVKQNNASGTAGARRAEMYFRISQINAA